MNDEVVLVTFNYVKALEVTALVLTILFTVLQTVLLLRSHRDKAKDKKEREAFIKRIKLRGINN